MMGAPLLSVIVPVYNTRNYLRQCLESIIFQTYRNLEIILIDDGSTDGSGAIVDEFAERDFRVIAIHQKNCGESNARNVGLRRATGDYIAFVDCDDWIEQNMYESLVMVLKTFDVDMVASSWIKETGNDSVFVENKFPISSGGISQQELLQYVYRRDDYQAFAYMWNKLYKRSAIFQNDEPVIFDENLRLGGDVLFLGEILLNVHIAYYIDKAFYHYRQRENSGCHTKDLQKRLEWLESYRILIEKFSKADVTEEILKYVKRFLAYHASNVAELALEQSDVSVYLKSREFMLRYKNEYVETNSQYTERLQRFDKLLNSSISVKENAKDFNFL